MFAYFTDNMDFKTSVQLQLSKNVSKTFEAHVPPRGRSFGCIQTKVEQRNMNDKVNLFHLILLRIMVF